MNIMITKVTSFFKTLFTKSKKVISLPHSTEEYDGWLGI